MKIVSLASGSKGNAYCVASDGQMLLIDCGLCLRDLQGRFKVAGVDPRQLVGVLITHNHIDHIKGLCAFHNEYPEVDIYANAMTADAISSLLKMDDNAFVCFENGQEFEVGKFKVHPFSIPHDTCDPVGYLVSAGGESYFHGTDIGTPLDSIGVKLALATCVTLEANHDPMMLKNSGRPFALIQRISGPRGHLSNDQACELLRRFVSPKLRYLALAHLSRDCNNPELAVCTIRETLEEMGRQDISLNVLEQDSVCWISKE